jgi:hypothetical protein
MAQLFRIQLRLPILANEYNVISSIFVYWSDKVPLYGYFLIFWTVFLAFQLIGVEAFGEAEFWLALVKLLGLTAYFIFAIVYAPLGFRYWHEPGPFNNNGFRGVATVFVFCSTFYAGVESVAVAATGEKNLIIPLCSTPGTNSWRDRMQKSWDCRASSNKTGLLPHYIHIYGKCLLLWAQLSSERRRPNQWRKPSASVSYDSGDSDCRLGGWRTSHQRFHLRYLPECDQQQYLHRLSDRTLHGSKWRRTPIPGLHKPPWRACLRSDSDQSLRCTVPNEQLDWRSSGIQLYCQLEWCQHVLGLGVHLLHAHPLSAGVEISRKASLCTTIQITVVPLDCIFRSCGKPVSCISAGVDNPLAVQVSQ